MKSIRHLFDGTPLEQTTYTIYWTSGRDEHVIGSVYSPTRICNWSYGRVDPESLHSRDMALHEICHVIDLYHRRRFSALLKNDYGFAFRPRNKAKRAASLRTEAFVMTLQHLISMDIFGESRAAYSLPKVYQELSCTKGEWNRLCKRALTKHEATGLQYYYETWQKACTYVKIHKNAVKRDWKADAEDSMMAA